MTILIGDIKKIDCWYHTSDRLFNAGMGACSDCGAVVSLDDKTCHNCDEAIVIIRLKHYLNEAKTK